MKHIYSGNRFPNEEQTLLLQACLLSDSSALDAWKNWKQRIDFDKLDPASFKLLPLVSRNPVLESLPELLQDPIFGKCKGIYRRVWVENQLNWKNTLPTLSQLLNAGVDKIVLLKGMAMILDHYKEFGVRVIGDIDILIERSQVSKADSILRDCGWQPKFSYVDINNPEHLKRWHALNYTHEAGMNLDLHWAFIEENCPALDESVLKGSQLLSPKNRGLHTPNPADLLLQACIHGMKHSPVPLIRWIVDAMTILRRTGKAFDWDRLITLASHAHICMPLSSALQYLVEQFDAPIPKREIQKLQRTISIRLEYLEYRFNVLPGSHIAAWARYCLNQGHLTKRDQFLHTLKFLQFRARLKSPWHIPFYGIYWILKRTWRALKRLHSHNQITS